MRVQTQATSDAKATQTQLPVRGESPELASSTPTPPTVRIGTPPQRTPGTVLRRHHPPDTPPPRPSTHQDSPKPPPLRATGASRPCGSETKPRVEAVLILLGERARRRG